ncbi:FG-GAP repeat domain-containing protein [Streptomyces sp. NPDC086023]|uniref:FG-GAP repeat domain-containing protein n=1 Tax=Streptomyces sp. NPDC086023 TaxID=3365746 RepID=UPI0037D5A430
MPRRLSRPLLATAVAAALAATGAPFAAVPVAAASSAAGSETTAVVKLAPGSVVLSAGTTGFLSVDRQENLVWTRYADGAATRVGTTEYDWGAAPKTYGGASDVVAVPDNPYTHIATSVTLRDMAAGTSDVIEFPKAPRGSREYMYAGAVGRVVVAWKQFGTEAPEMRLLSTANGVLTERRVALPAGARARGGVRPLGAGRAYMDYDLRTSTGTESTYTAVVDVTTGRVEKSVRKTGDEQHLAASDGHIAVAAVDYEDREGTLRVWDRAAARWTALEPPNVGSQVVAVTGGAVVYGADAPLSGGDEWSGDCALRAFPVKGGAGHKVLDHATSLIPAPDGSVLALGGTLAQGEGVYRITAAADGTPTVRLVASTGEPTKITLLDSEVPPVADIDREAWRPRWYLSRWRGTQIGVTIRHVATGAEAFLGPDTNYPNGANWIEWNWDGLLQAGGQGLSAPAGDYTWWVRSTPQNGIGPALSVGGTFKVVRKPGPHDYTDNASPDLLARDAGGRLWREDTWYGRQYADFGSRPRKYIGSGWQTYNRIAAAGNLGGRKTGDLVARDGSGVLWLYLGNGDGTFSSRVRISSGWGGYTQLTGGGDVTGDGRADLLARDGSGTLWLHRGTGDWKAPFASRRKVGTGWNAYNQLTSVGNVAGASAGDLVARDKDGVLWLYLGKGDGTFASRVKVGAGWSAYATLVPLGDVNADGKADVMARTPGASGGYVYRGTGDWRAPFTPRKATWVLMHEGYNTVL